MSFGNSDITPDASADSSGVGKAPIFSSGSLGSRRVGGDCRGLTQMGLGEGREFLPSFLLNSPEERRFLLERFNQLSDELRMTLLFYYFSGLTLTEIADCQQIPLLWVCSRLVRAEREVALRHFVQETCPPGETPVMTVLLREDAKTICTDFLCTDIWDQLCLRIFNDLR